MTSRGRTLKVTLIGDAKSLEQALGRAESRLSGFSKAVRRATLVGGAAMVGLGAVAIKFGSDWNESVNRSREVFGAFSADVEKFAKDSSQNILLSQRAAVSAAGTFGAMASGAGIAQESAAEISTELVKAASDISSFFDTDVNDALLKLRSGLSGETEPLRQLGVNFTAAEVTARALTDSLKSNATQLTEAEKVTARYNIIMEKLGATGAIGDAARTIDSFSNQTRVLRKNLDDLATQMGTILLPVAQRVVIELAAGLSRFSEWFEVNKPRITDAVNQIAAGFENFFGKMKSGLEVILPLVRDFFSYVIGNKAAMVGTFVAIGLAVTAAFGPVGLASLAIIAAIALIGHFKDDWRQAALDVIDVMDGLAQGFFTLKIKMVEALVGGMRTAVVGILDAIGWLVDKVPYLGDALGFVGSKTGLSPQGAVEAAFGGLTDLINAPDQAAKLGLGVGFDALRAQIGPALGQIGGPSAPNMEDMFALATEGANAAGAALGGLVSGASGGSTGGAGGGLAGAAKEATDWLDIWGVSIRAAATGPLKLLTDAADGLTDAFDRTRDSMGTGFGTNQFGGFGGQSLVTGLPGTLASIAAAGVATDGFTTNVAGDQIIIVDGQTGAATAIGVV